jgi:hypothetical protein
LTQQINVKQKWTITRDAYSTNWYNERSSFGFFKFASMPAQQNETLML